MFSVFSVFKKQKILTSSVDVLQLSSNCPQTNKGSQSLAEQFNFWENFVN